MLRAGSTGSRSSEWPNVGRRWKVGGALRSASNRSRSRPRTGQAAPNPIVTFGSHRVEAPLPSERQNAVRRASSSRAPHATETGWPPTVLRPDFGKGGGRCLGNDTPLAAGSDRGPNRGLMVPGVRLGGRFAGHPPETPQARCRLQKELPTVRGGIVKGFRKRCGSRDEGCRWIPTPEQTDTLGCRLAASQASCSQGLPDAPAEGKSWEPGFQADRVASG